MVARIILARLALSVAPVLVALTATLAFVACSPSGDERPIPVTIAEDSPAWDCATMGNRVCGPREDDPAAPAWLACMGEHYAAPTVTDTEAAAECDEMAGTLPR